MTQSPSLNEVSPLSPVNESPEVCRATSVLNFYFESPESDPLHVAITETVTLTGEEEAYQRRCKATPDWEFLDSGPLDSSKIRLVIIENTSGRNLQTNPTEEEKKELASKVLFLRTTGTSFEEEGVFRIPPGGFFVACPQDLANLLIRSKSGITKYKITLIPS